MQVYNHTSLKQSQYSYGQLVRRRMTCYRVHCVVICFVPCWKGQTLCYIDKYFLTKWTCWIFLFFDIYAYIYSYNTCINKLMSKLLLQQVWLVNDKSLSLIINVCIEREVTPLLKMPTHFSWKIYSLDNSLFI